MRFNCKENIMLPSKLPFKTLMTVSALLISSPIVAAEWAFDVYLDKSKIGNHTFTLDQNRLLTSRAKFNVKVLFIEAYKYDHVAKEQWQADCLTSLDADTTENKVVSKIKGDKKDNGFEVFDGKNTQTLPACSMTFAYWNPAILKQTKLLNPQNAEYLDVKVENLGQQSISVKGKATDTMHYKLMGSLAGKNKLNIELWYNLKNEWVALKSTTPEGYAINYKLK